MIFHFTTEAQRSQRKIENSERGCIAHTKHLSFFAPLRLCVFALKIFIIRYQNTFVGKNQLKFSTQRRKGAKTERRKAKACGSTLSHFSHIRSVISVSLWFLLEEAIG